MAKIRVKARKMTKPTVEYISVVDHAATRLPFRILKRDTNREPGMLDLSRIFKGDKTKTAQPTIAGLVVQKASNTEGLTGLIEAAGFDVSQQYDTDDNTVIYKQGEHDMADLRVVKVSDELLVLASDFDPFDGKDNQTIGQAVEQFGFYPSIKLASEVVAHHVQTLADSGSQEQDEVAVKADTSLADFQGYVSGLMKTLPPAVFALDRSINDFVMKQEKAMQTAEVKLDDDGFMTGTDADGNTIRVKPAIEAEGAPAETTAKADDKATKSDNADGETATKADDAAAPATSDNTLTELTTTLKAVADTVTKTAEKFDGLDTDLKAVKDSTDELAKRLDTVESVAKQAKDIAEGTVVTDGDGSDTVTTTAKKSDDDLWGGVLDGFG